MGKCGIPTFLTYFSQLVIKGRAQVTFLPKSFRASTEQRSMLHLAAVFLKSQDSEKCSLLGGGGKSIDCKATLDILNLDGRPKEQCELWRQLKRLGSLASQQACDACRSSRQEQGTPVMTEGTHLTDPDSVKFRKIK